MRLPLTLPVRALGLLLLELYSTTAAAQTDSVLFFYSPLLDSCEWGPSNTFAATNNTANGGVCAYIPAKNRLYACPAPDPYVYSTSRHFPKPFESPRTAR
jgi:hypothetical protein